MSKPRDTPERENNVQSYNWPKQDSVNSVEHSAMQQQQGDGAVVYEQPCMKSRRGARAFQPANEAYCSQRGACDSTNCHRCG